MNTNFISSHPMNIRVEYYPKLSLYRCVSHPTLNVSAGNSKLGFIRLGKLKDLQDEGHRLIIETNENEPVIKEARLEVANKNEMQVWQGDCNCLIHQGTKGSVKKSYTNDWMLGD